jgi:uncharacterized membrane protein YkoI
MLTDQKGLSRALIVALVLGIFAAGGYYFLRRDNNTTAPNREVTQEEITLVSPLPTDILTVESIRSMAENEVPNMAITSIELEVEDGIYLYKVKMADGNVYFFDAQTGDKVTRTDTAETVEVQDGSLPTNFATSITFDDARRIALEQKQNGVIEKIELEVEEGITVYSVRFNDDTRIDIDATTGAIVRNEQSTDDDSSSGNNSESGSSNSGSRDDN